MPKCDYTPVCIGCEPCGVEMPEIDAAMLERCVNEAHAASTMPMQMSRKVAERVLRASGLIDRVAKLEAENKRVVDTCANGRDCVALCEVWLDEHDPIRQAVRSGMLIPLGVCIRRPGACGYAHRHEVVCTAMGGRAAEMDAAWYVCRGVGRDAAAEAAVGKRGSSDD